MEEEYYGGSSERDDEEDIYNLDFREKLLEDDEISLAEDGFMRGYYEED